MKKLKTMQAAERAEAIQYLKDMFRLTFRVNGLGEPLPTDPEQLEDDYDYAVDAMMGESAGFTADDDEMEDFRPDFVALDAEDAFLECCIDYYQDVIAMLDARAQEHQKLLSLYQHDDPAIINQMNEKSKMRYQRIYAKLQEDMARDAARKKDAMEKIQNYTRQRTMNAQAERTK